LTPLCFGETEWIPDRYSVVKEQCPADGGTELLPRAVPATRDAWWR